MALIFMDSFDQHFTRNDLWRQKGFMFDPGQANQDSANGGFVSLTTDGTVPGGWNTIRTQTNTGSFSLGMNRNFPGAQTPQTVIVGLWFQIVTLGTVSTENIISLNDISSTGAGTNQIALFYNSSRQLTIARNGTTLATSTNTFTAGTWYHIELKTKIDPSVGTYEVRVNGSATNWIPAATGANTRASSNSSCNNVGISTYANTSVYAIKSVYVLDTTGSVANDFLGVCKITTLHPSGAGNYAQNIASTGSNFSATSKRVIDLDNSYVACGAVNNKDTYKFEDAPASGGSIFAVQHTVLARQDGAASRSFSPMARVSSTDYVSSTVWYPGSGYLYFVDPLTVNPNTNAQWTNTELAGAEFGYKVIS